MTMRHPKIAEIVRQDPRYAYEAYEFVFEGLAHTQRLLNRVPPSGLRSEDENPYHVAGQELVRGLCDLALREYGFLAPTVFKLWGIRSTDDFGEIVFNLIDHQLLSKTEQDSREDFHNVLDLETFLREGFTVRLEDNSWRKTDKT